MLTQFDALGNSGRLATLLLTTNLRSNQIPQDQICAATKILILICEAIKFRRIKFAKQSNF